MRNPEDGGQRHDEEGPLYRHRLLYTVVLGSEYVPALCSLEWVLEYVAKVTGWKMPLGGA